MADVFISYHEESELWIVRKICRRLEEEYGISCWYAARDMESGSFAGVITRAIRACKIFVPVLNQKAFQSMHIIVEAHLAFRRYNNQEEIMLLPFLSENCEFWDDDNLDYYLSSFQSVRFREDENAIEEDIGRLVRMVIKRLGKESRA